MSEVADFKPGMRVRVQMNGVPDTYMATVVEPSAEEWERMKGAKSIGDYVWVMPDPAERRAGGGKRSDDAVIWKPSSLTILGEGEQQ